MMKRGKKEKERKWDNETKRMFSEVLRRGNFRFLLVIPSCVNLDSTFKADISHAERLIRDDHPRIEM